MAERAARDALAKQGLKRCGSCARVKALSDFHTRRASNDGLAYKCGDCVRAYSGKWRTENPDAFKQWYKQNAVERRQYCSDWGANNRELKAGLFARWAKANPHKINALIAKRTALKLKASVTWADKDAIEAIYAKAARLTRETGIRHEVDHIYPLQGDLVCGLHTEANLQILTKAENIRKHNRMPEELGYA